MTEYLKNAGKDDDLDGHSENGDHGRDDQARTQPWPCFIVYIYI